MACGTTYDAGCDCTDRSNSAGSGNTFIQEQRAAAAAKTVDKIYARACSNASGLEFGAFEHISGDSYTCRGNCSGANLDCTAGSCVEYEAGVDFTAFDFDADEYIGCYFSGG